MNAKIWGRWVSRLFTQRRLAQRQQLVQRRLSVELLEDRVTPATISWTGAGANSFWSNAENWSLSRAPLATDDIVFGNLADVSARSPIYNLAGLPVFNSITISASGYTLGGTLGSPTVALSGPLNVGTNLGTQAITLNMQLLPPSSTLQQTFTINSGSHLIISGQLSANANALQAAQQTLTKSGAGVLELTSDNSTYTGAITLANNGGVVVISHANALGTGAVVAGAPTAGITTVNVNSQLQLKNVAGPINTRLKLNGTGIINDGALFNLAGNNTWAGAISLDSNSSFGGTSGTSLNITALISDLGAGHNLTKEGQGRLILSRVGGNTYRGQTIVNNGILTIRDPLSLGAGATAGTPQNGSPQSGTIVNFNSTTGEAGTLQLEFTGTLGANDPNGILLNPALPFNAVTNPYIGFQVYNDLLTLNGPGFGGIGALNSLSSYLSGQNIWSGNVTLGSPPPSVGSVQIGVAANSSLIVSGVIGDPNRSPQLVKVLPGRLILNNANTYAGGTFVSAGVVNIRDSRALGTGGASVAAGAALELEVDRGIDGTPQRNHNRNLGFDSVTGSGPGQEISVTGLAGTFTITFKGQTTAALPFNATAAQVQAALNALSTVNTGGGSVTVTQVGSIFRVIFNGALAASNQPMMTGVASGGATVVISPIYSLNVSNTLSISGTGIGNTGALRSINGINTYSGNITTNGSSIGVDADARPGHFTADANYFTYDHRLRVTGTIGGSSLTKLGAGHLILPFANTYFGATNIQQGWVTVQNNNSLGADSSGQAPTLRPYTTISDGAALHLKSLTPGTTFNLINNFNVSGNGILHPFSLINQAGAIQNLDGNNILAGIIQLNGNAGIGVEEITPPPAGVDPSQLTLTGYTWDFGSTAGGITKLGSQRLIIQSPGTYTGNVIVQNGVLLAQHDTALGANGAGTVTVQSGAALELGSSIPLQNGGVLGGLGIWGKNLVLNGSGNATFGSSTLTVLSGITPTTDPINTPIVPTDNSWRGSISLGSDATITIQPNSRLTVTGSIGDAINPAANGSNLTINGGGTLNLAGANTYRGTTFINEGVLTIANGQALGTPGNAEVQQLTLTDAVAGVTQFNLTFKGQTTGAITFTDDGPTDAAAIQAALNALTTIGGAAAVGGVATVAALLPGEYRITLGGSLSGFEQPLIEALATSGPGTIEVEQTLAGAGGTVIANGASLQLAGSFTVAGEPLLVQGQGNTGTPNIPTQWFQVGPAPITNGATPGAQNVTGRVTGTVVDPRDSNIIYMATAGSGAWKTIDGGRSWRPMFDAIPEIQRITVGGNPAGTFTLNFDGETTGNLSASSTPAEVQAALNNLDSIGGIGAQVTVTKATQGGNVSFTITFGGVLAGYAVDQIQAVAAGGATASVVTVQQGLDPRFAMYIGYIAMHPLNPNLSQSDPENVARMNTLYLGTGETNNSPDSFYGTGIYVSRDAGVTWRVLTGAETQDVTVVGLSATESFTLSYNGESTAPLSGHSSAAEVQTALNGLSTINGIGGSVTVTRSGIAEVQRVTVIGGLAAAADTYTLTFDGQTTAALAFNATPAQIKTALENLTNIGGVGGIVTVSAPTGVAEVQELVVDFGDNPTPSYTYTLTFAGQTTTALPYNATAAQIQAALEALSTIGAGNVIVTQTDAGATTNTYSITFAGTLGIYQRAVDHLQSRDCIHQWKRHGSGPGWRVLYGHLWWHAGHFRPAGHDTGRIGIDGGVCHGN
jgi:fibronectin-binding autotransporter adhesin